MRTVIKRFLNDEKGLETIEYAIISGLITVGAIATIASVGTWVSTRFNEVLTALNP
ncbi:MAG: Flp family type IVb pilin [Sedimentisphaerales bacterium]|nr:Flp family type IVb pilin [Sedimentisphaerales bacterium]